LTENDRAWGRKPDRHGDDDKYRRQENESRTCHKKIEGAFNSQVRNGGQSPLNLREAGRMDQDSNRPKKG